jgi:hypothetical protein
VVPRGCSSRAEAPISLIPLPAGEPAEAGESYQGDDQPDPELEMKIKRIPTMTMIPPSLMPP